MFVWKKNDKMMELKNKLINPRVVAHVFKPTIYKVKVERCRLGLHSEFQENQSYKVRTCFKTNQQTK